MPTTGSRKPKIFYGYFIVLASFFILVVMWGTVYTFGVFLQPLIAEFGWTRTMTSGAHSLCLLLFGSLSIVTGRLTDRFGPRIVTTVCGLLFGLGYLLMSQISAIWQLYLFYGVLVGVGVSSGWVPLVSIVARWFVKRKGLITGIVVSGTGTGIVIMPSIASRLITSYGWSTSYLILGVIALVLIILAAQFLKRDPGQIGQLPYGETEIKEESLNLDAKGFSLREAIHTRQLWMVCALYLCYGFCLQVILVHIVPHATELGISAITAANILVVSGGASIVGRIIMGSASDRTGNKLTLIISFILFSVTLLWLQFAQELWMLYIIVVIFSFGYGGFSVVMSPVVAELFGLSSHGVILGAVFCLTTIGGAIGPVLAGHIFDVTSSYQLAFLVFTVVCIVGFILTLLLKPITNVERAR